MKSQIAKTSKGPVEYTLFGNRPVVLVCHGTSQDCHSTQELELLPQTGFTGHFIWVDPEYANTNAQIVAFLQNKD